MKKLKLLGLLVVFFWTLQACNRPNQIDKSDSSEMSTDYNTDTTDIGKDTLGVGDGQGSDHTDDIIHSPKETY